MCGAPSAVCVGKKESVTEGLNLIKTILGKYLCICAFMFTSTFSMCTLHTLFFVFIIRSTQLVHESTRFASLFDVKNV